jgi:hypothetical protein
MRRLFVRGTDNVLKRVLVQAAAFNMGLLLRKLSGWGKPRQVQGRFSGIQVLLSAIFSVQGAYRAVSDSLRRFGPQLFSEITATPRWRVVFQ